jgi:hypothetical protein
LKNLGKEKNTAPQKKSRCEKQNVMPNVECAAQNANQHKKKRKQV